MRYVCTIAIGIDRGYDYAPYKYLISQYVRFSCARHVRITFETPANTSDFQVFDETRFAQ